MSEPVYKVGREIKVIYQAAGAETGKTIEMLVFDELQVQENFTTDIPPGQSIATVPEIGTSGRYRGTFTPDVEGDWQVQLRDSVGDTGKVVKHYEIGGDDIDSIGDATGLIKVQTDLLPGDPASQASIEAAITSTETTLKAEIDALESPALVG